MGAHGTKEDGSAGYPVKLTVFCDDRTGMLKQMTAVISDENINIRNIEARTANSQATVDFVIDIEDLKHLERIVGGPAENSRRARRAARAENLGVALTQGPSSLSSPRPPAVVVILRRASTRRWI